MLSPKYSFKGTGLKILISLGLALLGAVATWLLTITDVVEFGQLTPFVAALAPIIANAIKEFIKEKK